jgi:hypothetical protein
MSSNGNKGPIELPPTLLRLVPINHHPQDVPEAAVAKIGLSPRAEADLVVVLEGHRRKSANVNVKGMKPGVESKQNKLHVNKHKPERMPRRARGLKLKFEQKRQPALRLNENKRLSGMGNG